VQLLVDAVATGSSVALSGGSANFMLSTLGLAAGVHVLTAVYAGDAAFASSKGAIPFTITAAPAMPDFALTPAIATTAAASGGTAPGVVFSVAPMNGFSGNVSFQASSILSSAPFTYSFNVTPVAISAGASGSTTMTLLAYVPSARTTTGFVRFGAMVGGLFLVVGLRRRRRSPLLVAAISVGALGFFGCGSSSTGSTAARVANTPAGTYSVLVTATATSGGIALTHNATVNFVVQ
jgi:hypothetical protein